MRRPHWFLILYLAIITFGCSPQRNAGDLLVGSLEGGPISNDKSYGAFKALYGSEKGRAGKTSRKNILLVTVFVVTPENKTWEYVGGGSNARPFYNSGRWMFYPTLFFAEPGSDGYVHVNSERRNFFFEFNGRNRTITIAEKTYPINIGDFVFVKLNNKWEPRVLVGIESLNSMQIPIVVRKSIMKHLNIRKKPNK